MTNHIRNGKGHNHYRRLQAAAKAQAKATNARCPHCGTHYNYTNPNAPNGFTLDHPKPLAKGGTLLGQQLTPMCRSCNSRKNDNTTPTLRPPT